EAHPAGRAPEQCGVRLGGDLDHAGGRVQGEREHVVGEPAVDVVVLAVDVGGDGAADGHVPGTGRDGDEPAERHHAAHDRVEAHARVDTDDPAVEVDLAEAGQHSGVEHGAARVLGGVAVAAAEPAR